MTRPSPSTPSSPEARFAGSRLHGKLQNARAVWSVAASAFGDMHPPTTRSGGAAMFESRKHIVRVTRALGIVALTLAMATPVAANGPAVVHRVSAGGPDQCSGLGVHPGCDGNYSLVATRYADGSASGQYTDRFGRIGGIRGVVDCLVVVGNDAWISGWILS